MEKEVVVEKIVEKVVEKVVKMPAPPTALPIDQNVEILKSDLAESEARNKHLVEEQKQIDLQLTLLHRDVTNLIQGNLKNV